MKFLFLFIILGLAFFSHTTLYSQAFDHLDNKNCDDHLISEVPVISDDAEIILTIQELARLRFNLKDSEHDFYLAQLNELKTKLKDKGLSLDQIDDYILKIFKKVFSELTKGKHSLLDQTREAIALEQKIMINRHPLKNRSRGVALEILHKFFVPDHKITQDHLDQIDGLNVVLYPEDRLSRDDFRDLPNLRSLFLNGSKSPITSFPEDLFDELGSLEDLHITGFWYLKTLPIGLFKKLKNLKTLRIEFGALEVLPESIFSFLTLVESISLERNQLKTLPPRVFQDLPLLKKIILRGNHLTQISKEYFLRSPSLEVLDLTANQIKTLDWVIEDADLSAMPKIYLSKNPLSLKDKIRLKSRYGSKIQL